VRIDVNKKDFLRIYPFPPHARVHTYRRDIIILVDKPETFLLPTVAGHHDDDDDDDDYYTMVVHLCAAADIIIRTSANGGGGDYITKSINRLFHRAACRNPQPGRGRFDIPRRSGYYILLLYYIMDTRGGEDDYLSTYCHIIHTRRGCSVQVYLI